MPTPSSRPDPRSGSPRSLDVELLALDLSSCSRCTGTLASIEKAIELVRPAAEATGTALRLRKLLVTTEEEARRHRFTSSPTIRVDGSDIVFETLESPCGDCSDLCGCSEGTSCRIWRYQGQEHEEAPVGLVVEALLRELVAGSAAHGSAGAPKSPGYELPENLRRYFAGRSSKGTSATPASAACCPPSEQATCCEPEQKAGCCTPAATTCGCA